MVEGAGVGVVAGGVGVLVRVFPEPDGAGATGISAEPAGLSVALFWHPITASRASSDMRAVFFMGMVGFNFVF
jgi:hypothetical protein